VLERIPNKGEDAMKKVVILLVVVTLFLGGCSNMSATQQRVLSGGAIGASSGALIGWAAGSPAAGAAIGGGAGMLGGFLYDRYEKYRGRP
jgi:osmotically inducible lipoprotein OsmB